MNNYALLFLMVQNLFVAIDVFYSFANGGDLLSIVIRNFSAEFIFESHDQLYEIE